MKDIEVTIDLDRIADAGGRFLASRRVRLAAVMLAALVPLVVVAAVSKPYTFKDGETISASQMNANFDAMVDGINAAGVNNATFRWTVFSTYHENGGWFFGNDSNMFGGVNPSNWTDNDYYAGSISANKELQRTLFTKKGYAKANANIWSEIYQMYSSTNGKVVAALFRVKNSTTSNITWTPYYYYTAYSGWNERASVALNGSNVWTSGGVGSSIYGSASVDMTIPANRVSTVIFVATSSYPYNPCCNMQYRAVGLSFYNNSLSLPSGLSFVDDLDTASGDYSQ